MWKHPIALACVLPFLWTAPAEAYKPESHVIITRNAWPAFRQCLKAWGMEDHQLYRLNSVDLEDDMTMESWNEDKAHLIRRGRNWHFLREDYTDEIYDPPILRLFKIHKSVIKLFEKIEKKWKKNAGPLPGKRKKRVKRFKLAGRALHHTEDATVPAHVIPVYHGPSIPKMGKERGVPIRKSIPDEIDAYPGKYELEPDLNKFPKACEKALAIGKTARASADPMQEILKITAAETRKFLERPINEKKFGTGLKWHFFWKKPNPHFFGTYNVPVKGWKGDITNVDCAKNKGGLFGKPDICFNGQHRTISRGVYNAFVQDRLDKALTADVAMLYVMFLSRNP